MSRVLIAFTLCVAAGCDHGLSPPEEPPKGTIVADISYTGPWPPAAELHELLFVALRFVPRDTSDLLQLGRMAISDRLEIDVPSQRIIVEDVRTGPYLYSGVAQKYGSGTFDWKPIGLVRADDGIFVVSADETTYVDVDVDFDNPPVFPPTD